MGGSGPSDVLTRAIWRIARLMAREEPILSDQRIANWSDLVEFEIVPVIRRRRCPHGRGGLL